MSNDIYFKASLQNTLNPEVGTFDNEGNKEGVFTLEDGEYYLTNTTSSSYRVYYPTETINSVGFTIEFDVNYDGSSGFGWCLLFNGNDNAYWHGFGVVEYTLQYRGSGLSDYTLIGETGRNKWLHIKCIFDYDHNQNNVHIYIDNVEVNNFTISKDYDIKYIDILGNGGGFVSEAKIKNIIIYKNKEHYLDTNGLTSVWSKIKSLFATKSELASKANSSDVYNKSETDTLLLNKANTSDLATVATSGDYNDLSNKPVLPQINVDASDGSWVISRDTDGNFFRMVHTGWSRSGSNSWAGMYFQTSDGHDIFGFATRQSTSPLEKFTVGNNGYLRGYDTNGNRSVTLTINGGTAGKPDTQNITVDGVFINAGDQKPYSANMYTIGTSDMPYKAMYAGTFVGNVTGNASTATTATTAEACTGNSATATKLAAARTIALSGAVTGTATAFDGSGNITIPVTALAASSIRAQWYAAYPDGAEAHNAMWGGRDITDAFNNGTVSRRIADGTFRDIFPGDYITKQVTVPRVLADDGTTLFAGGTCTVNWVVADCDYWINKGNTATTAHHVAIVPQTPIFNARMNATNTTEGGYAGSDMYKKIIPACATGIVNAFGSEHILTFRDHLTRDLNTSVVSSGITVFTGAPNWNGAWYSQQCNLMSEAMVYDGPHCASSALDNITATRQMSAFRLSERLVNYNRMDWWLRDVVSSAYFADVSGHGCADTYYASVVLGVRPFALLE